MAALTAAGVVASIISIISRRETNAPRTTSSVGDSRLDHSPVISGSHNNVFLGHSTVSNPTEPARRARPARSEGPLPNLVYTGAKQKKLFGDPSWREGIRDPQTEDELKDSVRGLVLKFENRPTDRTIARARNVIAKLKFRHKNRVTERDIDYGFWLYSPCNSTEIGIGDTRELVLVYVDDEGKFKTLEDKRLDNRDFPTPFSYGEDCSVEDYEFVDVTLIDQNSQAMLHLSLKFWRDGTSICTSVPN